MKKYRSFKQRILAAFMAIVMLTSSLIGTTFAWFTDSVTSGNNIVQTGNLDAQMHWSETLLAYDSDEWQDAEDGTPVFNYNNWEPGYTEVRYVKVSNAGSLAFKWKLNIEANGTVTSLADVIDVYYVKPVNSQITSLDGLTSAGKLSDVLATKTASSGTLTRGGYEIFAIAFHMDELAGNEYQNTSLCDGGFSLKLLATQATGESDSFGPDYDAEAQWPEGIVIGNTASATVTADANNKLTAGASMISADGKISASVPAGTLLSSGTNKLTLNVANIDKSRANITLDENEAALSIDVHILGVAENNETVMAISVKELLPVGLNMGNYRFYHVEDGQTVEMTLLADGATPAHNNYEYDPATGDVVLHLASFSEVALVADTENAWEGNFDYTWYDASKTDFVIANADQLAAFGAIVGGMDGQTQDSFSGKTVKLVADINLGDKESENNPNLIFYPIGYNSSDGKYEKTGVAVTTGFYNFSGTFDGNGHTVSNFYHNTWEMKGDNNYYDATLQYYRDGMGLFGRVYGGTIKNLTVSNFSSDGEYTTTGVIAAYADGATFENIAIFNCNPRVYNIGNGGIVGCVGWYAKEKDLKTTFKNITVDNSNKISALWGSYDVACGGIVGQYYPTSGQTSANKPVNGGISFENCHVSAIMDVYNDVCANYQYYAYRYTGMLIGSVRENVTIDGHSYPKMDGITASGCTVHFGDWNDYYYCEIIDNTTASYTHDYQMSRLTEIKAIDGTTITYLDGTTGTVPASGRANYVIVDYTKGHGTENATCYHFKDGAVWTHDMGGIQTGIDENGDGQDDLKEDKQHIYLEFNNLVTGYGWGVTSRGLTDFKGVANMDITEGREESVEKFESTVTELANNKTYKLGDIFSFVDKGVELKPGALAVSVTNLDENNPVSATIVYDRKNWENGTIEFTGAGKVTITIQDYYFCTPTTIEVTITDRQPEVKFETKFNNTNFTYRIGNAVGSAVALGTLFTGTNVTNGNVTVAFATTAGNATGNYIADNTDWSKGAIQFSGTGVVKVTITDNDYCTPTVLLLEVVDAVNATGATSATSNNVVLLNDANFGSLEVSGGYTLYGNGFTLTCGSDSVAADLGYAFVTLENGTLDNVQIVCPNFDYAALYKSNLTSSDNRRYTENGKTRYYNARSGVMVSGNSQILNSRISGARAAVNVTAGNCVIDNSRIELGAVASLLIGAANSVTLRDVTLVQKPTASTYDPNETLMGFSVLYMCDSEGKAASTTLEGTLIQQAWANENDKQYVPSAGQDIVDDLMKKDTYIHKIDGKDSLNLGFAYLPEDVDKPVSDPTNITDARTNRETVPYANEPVSATVYVGMTVTLTTYVYSYQNTKGTNEDFVTESSYVPNKYSDIITVTYSDTADGLEMGKSFGTDGWVYELNVDLDKLSNYKLDFSKLSTSVNGVTITDYKVNGENKPSTVVVNAGGTTYTLTITVNGNEYNVLFKVTGVETAKRAPYLVDQNGNEIDLSAVSWTAGTRVTSGSDWSAAAPVLKGVYVKYWSVAESEYKVVSFESLTPTTSGKKNESNNWWQYTHENGDFTLKITNTDAIHSGKGVYGMPVVYNDVLYFTISSTNGMVSSSSGSRNVAIEYVFTDNNSGSLTFKHTWTVNNNTTPSVKYTDMVPSSSGGGGCVTPDTLITLADGTQKRIDEVTYEDKLLVWDFFKGEYAIVPSALIVNHGYGDQTVIKLTFEDGTVVKAIGAHSFFDADTNKWELLDANNASEYVGHNFVQADGDSYTLNKLVDIEVYNEHTESYSLVSAYHYNFITENMFSLTNAVHNMLAGLVVGKDMTYDMSAMEQDLAHHGQYTYEDFADYISYEQYIAFNGDYLKISVEKGYITFDGILALIDEYLNI